MKIQFRRLDVCPLLARGEEPFTAIRTAVDSLGSAEGLLVVAPFLPAPLVEMLRSEGFETQVEPTSRGRWVVRVWRGSADPFAALALRPATR
jgi:hypothetical protein